MICTGDVIASKPIEARQELLDNMVSQMRGPKSLVEPLPDAPEVEGAHAGRPRTPHAWIHTKGNAVRARVSPTFSKRLAAQEQRQSAKRTIGLWPAILGLDEWEALAEPHQAKLCADTRGDEPVVTTEALRDPADVTHLYKPGGVVFATRIRY